MPSRPDETIRLSSGDVALTIDPVDGGRATSWTVGGHELLAHHGADPVEYGMYVMAPWAGRIRGNAIDVAGQRHDLPVTYEPWALHGTVVRERAEVLDVQQGPDARLVTRVTDHPGWPWPMTVDVTWELSGRTLVTTIEVIAHADPFPVVVGWHPWFRRRLDAGDGLGWSLAATGRLLRGADHLPADEVVPFDPADGPFDDAFVVPDGSAVVRWPGVLRLDIDSDAPWYVVFDELPDCVCVEPQSGPPDGLHDSAHHVVRQAAPGQPHRLVTTWTMRDDLLGDPA